MQWVHRTALPPDLKMEGRPIEAPAVPCLGYEASLFDLFSLPDKHLGVISVHCLVGPAMFYYQRLPEPPEILVHEDDLSVACGRHRFTRHSQYIQALVPDPVSLFAKCLDDRTL